MGEKSESNIEKSIKFRVEKKVAWITIDNQEKGTKAAKAKKES